VEASIDVVYIGSRPLSQTLKIGRSSVDRGGQRQEVNGKKSSPEKERPKGSGSVKIIVGNLLHGLVWGALDYVGALPEMASPTRGKKGKCGLNEELLRVFLGTQKTRKGGVLVPGPS